VEEWDALERIWEYGLNAIHADASQHPLLVAEPAYSTTTQRERMAELLFESFRAPAMYLARSPVLSAFSMGRSSAVVVDIGACGTRVTPVHDGYILNSECRSCCFVALLLEAPCRRVPTWPCDGFSCCDLRCLLPARLSLHPSA
jgi:actin-related protein